MLFDVFIMKYCSWGGGVHSLVLCTPVCTKGNFMGAFTSSFGL